MRSTVWIRLLQASLVLVLGATAVSVAAAGPAPNRPRRPRAVSLFAGANLVFEVNRIQCNLVSSGEVCSAGGSPIGGGGFWPKGTPDQYIFNSGLQLAGVIPANAGFAWAGDTIGAYFFDARGDQAAGEALTGLFSALNPSDLANWPTAAKALDPGIYNPVLLNRNVVSQGDAWVRYWEGNPSFLTGREHPMGIVVDQRTLGWNFPVGNEDIIYHVFTFYNVSASAASGKYTNATIPAAIQAEIAAQGDAFRALQLNRFNVAIPDTGYPIVDLFAAFAMDADVAIFNQNYSTAILPFNMATIYSGTFLPEVGWRFPEDIFGAPFYPAAGFIGVKYLRSPTDALGNEVGLTMFSATLNAATGFPDPVGVRQLYRYLSGFVGPTDNPCSPFTNPVVARLRRLCFLGQTQADARFYQASGPFVLPPGEARTIVVAFIQAAPLDIVQPLVGSDNKPGIPFTGDSIFTDRTKIRTIERIAGWVDETGDANGNSAIDEAEVVTAPRSLLDKAKVAQAVFNSKFLLPFAPDAPEFYLVPGDNQVTVVWKASASEQGGDPFFVVAGDPGSALYDPNFREFDVEGYRIYRGRSASELELVAQFDYTGTSYLDYTGQLAYGDNNGNGLLECAPELGVTADCPTFPFEAGLAGDLVQVPAGGRVLLANGSVLVTRADTAITGGGAVCGTAPCPPLENTGVPFAFVDAGVRNSFTYFYTVTAFDVNSLKSGPTALESPRVTKRITPRKSVSNQVVASLSFDVFGDNTTPLDPSQPANWTIDATTGRFPGPPPPTGGLAAVFAPLVPQLLGPLNLTATIDSVLPRSGASCPGLTNTQGICYEFFASYISGSDTDRTRTTLFWPIWTGFGEASSVSPALAGSAVPADSESAARFGIPNGATSFNAAISLSLRQYIDFSAHEGQQSRRFRPASGTIGNSPGGSRWFDGANETINHPTYGMRAGHITGVDSIFAPLSHIDAEPQTTGAQAYTPDFSDAGGNTIRTVMQCHPYSVAALGRQADIKVTWGAGGTIASVRDSTHHVNVPFHAVPQAGYGFITDQNGNGRIDWRDFDNMNGVRQANAGMGFCAATSPAPPRTGLLVNQPVFGKVTVRGSSPSGDLAGWTATGVGFGIYINGQQFIFQMSPDSTATVTPPAAGTVWTLRSYAGRVDASSGAGGLTPSGYSLTPATPSPAIPGIRVVFTVPDRTQASAETADILDNVHTVPDPYYVANALEFTAGNKVLKFVNLPPRALIRIYSLSGVLVNVIAHNDPGLGAEATWNLRNRNNQLIASGVYFYHVETPAGNTKVGRFTVVTFAP